MLIDETEMINDFFSDVKLIVRSYNLVLKRILINVQFEEKYFVIFKLLEDFKKMR